MVSDPLCVYEGCRRSVARLLLSVELVDALNLLTGTAMTASRPTVCVSRVWASVDKPSKQKKLKAREKLLNRADSHTSAARFVGRLCVVQDSLPEKEMSL